MKNQEFKEKHPFKPSLIAKPILTSTSTIDRIMQSNELYERERLQKERELQQYRELQACSFKPTVNKRVPKQSGPIVIRGLGSHLDRVDRAKKMREEQKVLEDAKRTKTKIYNSTTI